MYQVFVVIFCMLAMLLIKKLLQNKAYDNKKNLFNDPEEDAYGIIEMYMKKKPGFLRVQKTLSQVKELIDYNIKCADAQSKNFI